MRQLDEQIKLIAKQVRSKPIFWFYNTLALLLLIATASGFIAKFTHYNILTFEESFSKQATNDLSKGLNLISSNVMERLNDTNVQATLQKVVDNQASGLLSNSISPALSKFEAKLNDAKLKLESIGTQISNLNGMTTNLLALSENIRWRRITPEQSNGFMAATKNMLKFPIRIRYRSNTPEVVGYARNIRDVLDAAGFIETNSDAAFSQWPEDMDITWTGHGDFASVVFVSSPKVKGNIVDLQGVKNQLLNYTNVSSNIMTEFVLTNGESAPAPYIINSNGQPIVVLTFATHTPFWISGFTQLQSIFYGMGISSSWLTTTNLPEDVCEIFINPKF